MRPYASGAWGDLHLNVFHPQGGFEGVQQEWGTATEVCRWEVTVDGVRLRCDERRLHLDPERHILYPELVYRRYVGGVWIEDAVLKIPRRCFAPDAFEQVILRARLPDCPALGWVCWGALWGGTGSRGAVW